MAIPGAKAINVSRGPRANASRVRSALAFAYGSRTERQGWETIHRVQRCGVQVRCTFAQTAGACAPWCPFTCMTCQHCNVSLRIETRKGTKFCSASCRAAAWRVRENAKNVSKILAELNQEREAAQCVEVGLARSARGGRGR